MVPGAGEAGVDVAGAADVGAGVDAAGYRIYPPEDTDSLFIPQPTTACSNADITLLSIGAFQPA